MARPKRLDTVDYFPHFVKPGKTLFILEGRWGNDGYAAWFKILELLAASDGHFYDASTPAAWQFLVVKLRLTPVSATEMISLLAELGNLDPDLWGRKVLWCQALVDILGEVYRKRKRPAPKRPFCDGNPSYCDRNPDNGGQNPQKAGLSTPRIIQRKGKEIKEKEYKEKENRDFKTEFESFYQAYPRKVKRDKALEAYLKRGKKGELPPLDTIIQAIETQKKWHQWTDAGGEYIPYPASWLNAGSWADQPAMSPKSEAKSYVRPGDVTLEN